MKSEVLVLFSAGSITFSQVLTFRSVFSAQHDIHAIFCHEVEV